MKNLQTFEEFLNENLNESNKSLEDSYTKYAKSIKNTKTESITAFGWLNELPRSTKISDIESVLKIYFTNHPNIISDVLAKAKEDGFKK